MICLAGCTNPLDDRVPATKTPKDRSATNQATQTLDSSNDLTVKQARELIPKAASLSPQEFQAILKAPPYFVEDLENQSLTAVLLAIDPDHAQKQNSAARRKFHYVGSPLIKPDPERLRAAVQGGPENSFVSIIQPEYITDCTCLTRGDTAKGEVAFRAKGLYSGEVSFTAKRMDNKWEIVAFDIPEYGLLTERLPDGTWHLVSGDTLLGIKYP